MQQQQLHYRLFAREVSTLKLTRADDSVRGEFDGFGVMVLLVGCDNFVMGFFVEWKQVFFFSLDL